MFKPKLINSLKNYSIKTFFNDLIAGIIVGLVALPMAIAFSIASGVAPEAGLFTAIIAGFCISAFGGSSVQIGGPTGAFSVIIYGIIANFGLSGLTTATLLAGIILILLGVFKLGKFVKYIPYTVIIGFTAGIALTIFVGQIGDFLGLSITKYPLGFDKMPGDFIGKIKTYILNINSINLYSLIVATISLIILFNWSKISKKIPGSLVVILLSTIVTVIISKYTNLELETIGSRFGEIPSRLPSPKLPDLRFETIIKILPSSLSIAALAAIESLLSAVVADEMIKEKHHSNTELIAQGIANIASPLFGGIPATGAIARTATNVKNGGRTPVAGIIHAITLLMVLLFLGKYTSYIPMSALAAVLINVAWNMSEAHAIKNICKGQKSDMTILFTTFVITVLVDLPTAIIVGIIVAILVFAKKTLDQSNITTTETVEDETNSKTEIIKINGPLFFANLRKIEKITENISPDTTNIIIDMENITMLDAGAIKILKQFSNDLKKKNIKYSFIIKIPKILNVLKKQEIIE